MYYLQNPENDNVLIQTNDRWFANKLKEEYSYVIVPMWKRRAVDALKDLLAWMAAGITPAIVIHHIIVPDYAEWWHFITAAFLGALIYDFLKEHVV